MRATTAAPIGMAASADPVAAGLVASLSGPGGNVTGVSLQTTDVARKRLLVGAAHGEHYQTSRTTGLKVQQK